jgi:alpha-D-xyloside xylohydrolase
MKTQISILNFFAIAFIALLAAACSQKKAYEKQSNGIVISQDKKKIRLQVLSADIIRVTVTPENSFSADTSLITVPQKETFTNWKVEEKPELITLSTPNLLAEVSLKTGEVVFKDSTGKILLEEKKGGGQTFSPADTYNGKGFYTIRQVFESPSDEAFYGLGGHQHGYMNYKGKDVDLTQHNIVDVIPFLYSNKNYGILWDNYSITKFGDPRDYGDLSTLKLFSKDGEPGGLTATYYVKDKVVKTQVEKNIDFEYLETPRVDSFPKDVNTNGKVVWEGSFTSDVEGLHKFLLYASNYFKLWVDDKLVMDKWRQNWNPWSNPFEVSIAKNEKHTIKVEWIPNGGYLALKHLDPVSPEEQNRFSLASEVAREIDYYFVRGNNADEVISGYRQLTGKAPIVPKWAMGFWQSRERYKTQDEILNIVKEFRDKKVPLDNIVLDWNYWPQDQWGSHKFDSARFKDAAGMVKKLHEDLHAHIMISVWPKFYKGIENYNQMNEKGYLYKNNIEKKRKDWIGQGYENTFYDAFNPAARKMFWDQINKGLYSKGFDAWWLDATEPDMHSNISIQARKDNMNPTFLGSGSRFFNAFSLMNSKGIYEEQRATNPENRVFILTRSAFAGQQRFGAATWSGDIVSRWSDMKDQIAVGTNFSISGIPYWTMDIGGFAVENRYGANVGGIVTPENLDEWRELQARWYQFGAFCPLFRAHGQLPLREPFNIAPENHPAYKSILYYDKLRYRLMPYIYTLAGKAYHDNYTIMRALIMDFNGDKSVTNINDQFMMGPSLLVNPVCEYKARERNVYLPSAVNWYDLYSGNYFEGGNMINAKAPYETIPVFVKEGSILPVGPEIQYVNQIPDSSLTLFVYGGKDGQFELYEDESTNYNYEQGAFTKIPFSYDEKTGMLSIGKRKGSFKGMLEDRSFRIVFVSKDKPAAFDPAAKTTEVVRYKGDLVQVQLRK